METILYHYWRSSASWRVRWALAVKGIPFESVPVDIVAGEQLAPEHRARNPMTHVPALWIGGRALAESVAILEYLEEMYPMPALYPADPWARARVRQVVELVNSAIQPLQNLVTLARHADDAEKQKEWARYFNERGLDALEALLGTIAEEIPGEGGFAVGSALTAADLYITPQVTTARRFGVDVSRYPRILAAEKAALATEHAEGALPEKQPGAPPKRSRVVVEEPKESAVEPGPAATEPQAGEPQVEERPAEASPVEASPAEVPPVEQPRAEEPPAEDLGAELVEEEPSAPEMPSEEAPSAPAAAAPPPEQPAAAASASEAAAPAAAPEVAPPEPPVAVEVAAPEVPPPPEPGPEPVIEQVEPDHGPLSGGTTLWIQGRCFVEGARAFVGGTAAPTFRESDTILRVETPARSAKGAVEVRVENPDGQDDARPRAFRYEPPPTVLGVEPPTVSVKGGTVVTILGSDFAEGCAALIAGRPVPLSRVHSGRLEAVVSPHPPATLDVVVKNPDGQRGTRADSLRYADPPEIQAIQPARAYTTGGVPVVVRGRGFEPGVAVLFAGEPLAEVGFVDGGELHVTAPGHGATEAVEVMVVNPDGLAHRVPQAFAYEKAPPRIASVSPGSGPNAGGTRLTVRGTDLDRGCAAYVCGLPATVIWKSREEIEVVTPPVARDGMVDLRVVNDDDQAGTVEKAFRYDAPLLPPVLEAITPSRAGGAGGIKVTLFGDDFADGATVRFGAVTAEARFLNRKQIEATLPPSGVAAELTVDVTVENPDGVSSSLAAAFTYEARPAPAISAVGPAFGPTTGGTKVVIEGENFTRECLVYVGREYPKDLVIKSATEIHIVTAPRKTPGVVDVEVAAPGLPRAVAKNGFRYDAVPAPLITSVSPNVGGIGGGTEMTIAGKNFRKDTIVLVDGKPPKALKLVDAETLEVKTPPGDPNKMVDVLVRNPDGKEAVQKRAFLYDPRYR